MLVVVLPVRMLWCNNTKIGNVFIYIYTYIYLSEVGGKRAPASPTGRSFRFVCACDARCSYPMSLQSKKCRATPLSFIFCLERLYPLSPGPVSRVLCRLHSFSRDLSKKVCKERFLSEFSQRFQKEFLKRVLTRVLKERS